MSMRCTRRAVPIRPRQCSFAETVNHSQEVAYGGRSPGFGRRRVSPHTIRHTTATYLLRAGVDINTIRAWLGHVSLSTTNIYAQIDLEVKARAVAQLEPSGKATRRRVEPDLMQFLRSL